MAATPNAARFLRILAGIVGAACFVVLVVMVLEKNAYKARGEKMPKTHEQLTGAVLFVSAAISAIAAYKSGRNPWAWGLGGMVGIPGIVLAVLPEIAGPLGADPTRAQAVPLNLRDPAEIDLIVRITSGPEPKVYVGEHDRFGSDAPLHLPGFDVIEASAQFRAAMLDRARARAARGREAPSPGLTRDLLSHEAAPAGRPAEELGSALFDALFRDRELFSVYDGWRKRHRRGCMRLQIEPRWAPVAWEILRDTSGGSGVFLGMEQATPLVREVATAESFPDPVQVGPAGVSVLAAGANPIDLAHLDLDRERRLLAEALSGTVALTWVDQGEEALRRELRRPGAGYHVFHFAGHGSFDGKEGFIYLGREKRTPVSAEDLASMLLRCETLRLVVLNACQGAAAGKEADAVSIAERLVQRGIPAVLAMTSPILDETALQVVRDFYHSLSQGRPVQHAVNDLRLHLKRNQLEWAAPVLMMGNPRAPLFAPKGDSGA